MSNIAHYDLEKRVKERIKGMDRDEMRKLLAHMVDAGSVDFVRDLAETLRVK